VDRGTMAVSVGTGREEGRSNQSHFTQAWPRWLSPTINTMDLLCLTIIGWSLARMGPQVNFQCGNAPPATRRLPHRRRKRAVSAAAPGTSSSSGSFSASSPSASSSALSSSSPCPRLLFVTTFGEEVLGGGSEIKQKEATIQSQGVKIIVSAQSGD